MKQEKVFVKHISDKGLLTRICKALLQLNNKKRHNLTLKKKKKNERFERILPQKRHQMTNKRIKKSI